MIEIAPSIHPKGPNQVKIAPPNSRVYRYANSAFIAAQRSKVGSRSIAFMMVDRRVQSIGDEFA
jgi:hypothetical protein